MNIASSVELCNPQPTLNVATPTLKFLGTVDYVTAWQAMQNFTANRTPETPDEIWLLQHPPTYTQGQAGLPEHLLNPHQIPVVQIDRGGQVTYHGPGQIVAYLLLDLRRWKLNVRQLVRIMEQAVIDILADYHIDAAGRIDAPGVYVGDAKIAALGLKIKHSCCYHGLSFNINMDLTPYAFINPCGYKGLRVTQLKDFGIDCPISDLETRIAQNLVLALQRHRDAEIAVSNAPRRDPDLEEKLKNYARELRANLTDAEQRVWHLLRDRHFLGYKFRRQHPMGNYILDFYCAEANLAIELDGGQHLENAAYDLQRTTVLQRDGMQVLRFWNNDVLNQTEAVLTQIATVLLLDKQAKSEILKTPLTPALSPLAGRGSKVG